MARVKVCRLCGRQNEPDELFCTAADCGVSLADVNVVDSDAVGGGAADDVAAAGGGPDNGRSGGGSLPGQDGGPDGGGLSGGRGSGPDPGPDAGGRTVRDVGLDQAAACALVFPWGRMPVAGELGIGREAGFSPVSERLDAFQTVSRRHAVVAAGHGQWTVRDLGSTNGTFVNGGRLAAGETRALHDGDRVGFSQGLQVQVEIGASGDARGG